MCLVNATLLTMYLVNAMLIQWCMVGERVRGGLVGVDHINAQKYFIHLGSELLARGDNKKHFGQFHYCL